MTKKLDGVRVLITRPVPEGGPKLLKAAGVEVIQQAEDRPIGRGELLDGLAPADAAVVMLTEKIDDEILAALPPSFRCFANFAVGHDNLPLDALADKGVYATNTPDVLTDATADLAWALLLAAARRVVEADVVARSGQWDGWGPLQFVGKAVAGATLGIVGAGRIGRAAARRALGFDMQVLYTPNTRGEGNAELEAAFPAGRCRMAPLDELLAESDFVSLHTPLTPATRHLISRERLAAMKPGAVLVNTARGPVVDEAALIEALESRHLAAAGLDVFEGEPAIPERLRALPNAVILPHIGSATATARDRMSIMCAESVLAALRGEVPPRCLNAR